jgi:hypothetical protein
MVSEAIANDYGHVLTLGGFEYLMYLGSLEQPLDTPTILDKGKTESLASLRPSCIDGSAMHFTAVERLTHHPNGIQYTNSCILYISDVLLL